MDPQTLQISVRHPKLGLMECLFPARVNRSSMNDDESVLLCPQYLRPGATTYELSMDLLIGNRHIPIHPGIRRFVFEASNLENRVRLGRPGRASRSCFD